MENKIFKKWKILKAIIVFLLISSWWVAYHKYPVLKIQLSMQYKSCQIIIKQVNLTQSMKFNWRIFKVLSSKNTYKLPIYGI